MFADRKVVHERLVRPSRLRRPARVSAGCRGASGFAREQQRHFLTQARDTENTYGEAFAGIAPLT
jgi:hypothetical protein